MPPLRLAEMSRQADEVHSGSTGPQADQYVARQSHAVGNRARFGRCAPKPPCIQGQPSWLRQGITTAWGRWVDCAPGGYMPGGYVRRTGLWQRPLPGPVSAGSCHWHRQDRLSHSNRDDLREAKAMRARQHLGTSCHEPREAVHRGGCNAQRRAAPFWSVTNGLTELGVNADQPPAAAGACGM